MGAYNMNAQDKTRNAELEASQARIEQNETELQRHQIAASALTEAANREVAQARALDARVTTDREALSSQKIEIDRRASAKKAMGLYLMTGLLVVILVTGGIYFFLHR